MKCPIDQTTLAISERGGVEIDYCPDCRGVWLDRGELDKIIDRADSGSGTTTAAATAPAPAHHAPAHHAPSSYTPVPAPGARAQSDYEREHRAWQDSQRPRSGAYDEPRRKKKDNWLSELFD